MNHRSKSRLFSIIFMGFGQIYNGQYFKGIFLALLEIVSLCNIKNFAVNIYGIYTLGTIPFHYVDDQVVADDSRFILIDGVIALMILFIIIGIYIWNIVDAYKGGIEFEKYGARRESLSTKFDKVFPVAVMAPVFLIIIFITLVPLISSIVFGFTDYSKPDHLPPRVLLNYVGFDNFVKLFSYGEWKSTFAGVLLWTLIWTVTTTATTYIFGFLLAVFVESKKIRFKKFWRAILILPMVVPGFVTILVFKVMFSADGAINNLLLQLFHTKAPWFSDPSFARGMLLFVNLWLSAGGTMMFMSGIISSFPQDLYEAAELDGASEFVKMKSITLPLVFYSAGPLMLMTFANNVNNYGLIQMMTGGDPINGNYRYAGSTDILSSWIYKLTMTQGQYNMGVVISILLFIVLGVFSVFNIKNTRAFKEEGQM